MSKLILLPGNLSCNFVVSEIKLIKEKYDEVFILTYDDTIGSKKIAEQFNLHYCLNNKNYLKNVFSLKFIQCLTNEYVKNEIKENCTFSLNGLQRLFYILYYVLYMLGNYDLLKKEIDNYDGKVILYSFWLSKPAFLIAQFKGYKNVEYIISRAHGFDIYLERNKIRYLPFRKYLDRTLDEISFISNHGKNYFEKVISLKDKNRQKSKKSLYRLGSFNDSKIQKVIRTKDEILIASCSATIGIKRIDLIIDMISNIKKIKVKWIHVGDGKLQKKVKKLAEKNLQQGQYEFLGYVKNQDIMKVYCQYDVDFFINMSDSEGIPVSIMEAMSMGIPVIARNVGGISELVNKESGLLLEKKLSVSEKEKFVTFIEQRLTNLTKYEQHSEESRNFWIKHYDANKNYNEFFEHIT